MKKIIAVLFAIMAIAVFAGADDLLVYFSTPGPDMYADGKTIVLDGERYALVYTKDGVQQTVLVYGGTGSDGKIYGAKDGKCPPVMFVVSDGATKYTGGEWGVFLLDTRDFAADPTGATLSEIDEKTKLPAVINVKAAVANAEGNFASAATDKGVVAGDYDHESANVKQPVVTGISVVGAQVYVTVANTVPFVGYTLSSGDDVSKPFALPKGSGVRGDTTKDITLVTEKKDGAAFFKVSTVK